MTLKDIPLPEKWPVLIRQAMIHASSLAHYCIIFTRSKSANSSTERVRLKIENDRLKSKVSQLENQLRINQERFKRVSPKSRPHYTPLERMDILMHKAVCGWNLKQTAEAFMVNPDTISSWMRRIDDDNFLRHKRQSINILTLLNSLFKSSKSLSRLSGKRRFRLFSLGQDWIFPLQALVDFLKACP